MRRDMDEVFGDGIWAPAIGHRRRGGFCPAVDVFYEGQPPRAIVHAELAAVSPDAIGLEIQGRKLVIAGHRAAPKAEGRLYQQIEILSGSFRRVVELGAEVVADEATAVFTDGILRVELPLAEPGARSHSVPVRHQREGGEVR